MNLIINQIIKINIRYTLAKTLLLFISGSIGVFLLSLMLTLIEHYDVSLKELVLPESSYRMLIQGGLWTILFILPISRNIFVNSLIIGSIVTLFNMLLVVNILGKDFFSNNIVFEAFTYSSILNYLWSILAATLYYLISIIINFLIKRKFIKL